MMKGKALVQCGNCGLKEEIPATPSNKPVDIFCKFIDHFYRGEKVA
jgi:transcription elongation factor Elf1